MQLQSDSIKEIAKALAKAQSTLGAVPKSGKNPHFNSKFPTLEDTLEAARKALTENDIAFPQPIVKVGDDHYIVTTFLHTSGEWLRSYLPLFIERKNMQGLGSAITYGRRYALLAMAGLAAEDDDGNASVSKEVNETKKLDDIADPKFRVAQYGNLVMDVGKKHLNKTFKELAFNEPDEAKHYASWINSQIIEKGTTKVHQTLLKFHDYMSLLEGQ